MVWIWRRFTSLQQVLEAASTAATAFHIRLPGLVIQCAGWKVAESVCYLLWSRPPLRHCCRVVILLWIKPESAPSQGCAVATYAVWCLRTILTYQLQVPVCLQLWFLALLLSRIPSYLIRLSTLAPVLLQLCQELDRGCGAEGDPLVRP